MRNVAILSVCVLAAVFSGCGPSSKRYTVAEQKQIIDEMAAGTVEQLYRQEPAARKLMEDSVGCGVFSNGNVNVILASFGGGYGVVTDKAGNKTYMHMGLAGIGLGIGAKDYRQVLIFRDSNTLDSFVNDGWEFGGHADAAAKAGESGGELSGEGDINDDIIVYSMTEAGLALQATVTGAKYWKDDDLN
jgi:lipid-binding SYLF domain-containing protein